MARTQANRYGRRGNISNQQRFASIPSPKVPRSAFDRSHGFKTTFDSSKLVPIFVDEALPGDTHTIQYSAFARMPTMLHPMMDNLHMDFFWFAVPIRLLWDNWQKFMGEQENPGDSTSFLVPQIQAPPGGWQEGDLADYFGIPTKVPNLLSNALHFRAYNLIWNEWFRSQDLQNSVSVFKDDGPDGNQAYPVLKRGKRHDYFTSCLPWPQKGPAITLPLGTSAPTTVDGLGLAPVNPNTPSSWPTFQDTGGSTGLRLQRTEQDDAASWSGGGGAGASPINTWWDDPNLHTDLTSETWTTDLTNATAATINELRQSFQIQRLYERDARGGTRYQELLRSHFGVISPDARLQRPEFLGGGTTPIIVNPVPRTASADQLEAAQGHVGDLGAYSIAAGAPRGWTKSFTEHCVIIGLVNVRADLNYQQGLNRMWSRQTRWDFYWPTLAHLGEQVVEQGEIMADGTANDQIVFGYQERYAEYRYKPSLVTGQFRSNATTPLDTWHLALDFATPPQLDEVFITDEPPIDRVIAVVSEPQFLFDAYFKYRCVRPMPTYSVPGLIDHF